MKSPSALEQNALRAARYSGEAAAMAVNLLAVGNSQRAELWQAERQAWQERQDAAIDALPLNRQAVRQQAAEEGSASFVSSLVDGLSDT